MIRKIIKIFLVLFGLAVLGVIIYIVMLFSAFGAFDRDYSVSEIKQHFNEKEKQITELNRYFHEIVPNGYFVEIEFASNRELERFGINELSSDGEPSYPGYLDWHVKVKSEKTDSIISRIGWTRETLKELKKKLDDAGCIQIANSSPTQIGFQRAAMGMYFYRIFDKDISDKQKEKYNDSCTFILVNNRLALEYLGGAIGSQCFYNFN